MIAIKLNNKNYCMISYDNEENNNKRVQLHNTCLCTKLKKKSKYSLLLMNKDDVKCLDILDGEIMNINLRIKKKSDTVMK